MLSAFWERQDIPIVINVSPLREKDIPDILVKCESEGSDSSPVLRFKNIIVVSEEVNANIPFREMENCPQVPMQEFAPFASDLTQVGLLNGGEMSLSDMSLCIPTAATTTLDLSLADNTWLFEMCTPSHLSASF